MPRCNLLIILTMLLTLNSGMSRTTCSSDPFQTSLLMSHLHVSIPILQNFVHLCLTTRDVPIYCKSSKSRPRNGKNYKHVSNLYFFSKVIEKVISINILGHILDNNIVDSFPSAYRAGHRCETDELTSCVQ